MGNDVKILVVDDEAFIRISTRDCLLEAGFKDIVVAGSAEQAYDILGIGEGNKVNEKMDLDCILMDLAMPGIDGIEACRKIKSCSEYSDVPIIIITSMKDENLIKVSLEAGAAEYLIKPVSDLKLVTRINAILNFKNEIALHKNHEKELELLASELQHSNRVLKEMNEKLRKLSHLDELAGIANQIHFEEQFFIEWRRAIRYKTPFSLIILKIDFLDAYKEHYGQDAYEECLKMIAKKVSSGLKRPTDLAARYAVEDLAVLLPDTDLDGAVKVANTLRKSVKELSVEHKQSCISDYVTISLGVASVIPTTDIRPAHLIESAEKMLAVAIKYGGNQVKSSASEDKIK